MSLPDNPIARKLWGRIGAGQHGDTARALKRLSEIREQDRLSLKVDRQFIIPVEEQVARFKPRFRAIVEGILARPFKPAESGEKPVERLPITALIKAKDTDATALADSPGARAIVAVCGCRWPIGEPDRTDFHFCNRKRALHFYCEAHERKSKK